MHFTNNKKMNTYIISLTLIFGTLIGYSQDSLSLDKALNYALENNFDIVVSKMNDSIAMTNNTWGAAGALPFISFSGVSSNTLHFDLDETDTLTPTTSQAKGNNTTNILNADLALNWVLFDGFKVRIRKDQFELLESLSKGNSLAVVEATIQSTIRAYYQVLIEKQKLSVLEKLQAISEDRYTYEQLKMEYGNSNSFLELQAKTNWLNDKTNVILQKSTYNNAIRNLKYTINIPDSTVCNVTDSLNAPDATFDIAKLEDDFVLNNANLKTMYINLELQKQEIRMAKSDYFPTLSLSTGAEYTHSSITYDGFDAITSNGSDMYANLALNYDIYKAGYRKRAVQVAKINEAISNIEIEDMKRTLSNHLLNTFELYTAQQELLIVANESLLASEINLKLAEEKFKNGSINSFNYRDIQLSYLQSELSVLNAKSALIGSYTELLRLSGKIIGVDI